MVLARNAERVLTFLGGRLDDPCEERIEGASSVMVTTGADGLRWRRRWVVWSASASLSAALAFTSGAPTCGTCRS